jgi:transmembrane sensor
MNEASPAEEGFVIEWMNAEEKNKLYVEEMGRMLQLIALKKDIHSINVHEEWEQFKNQNLEKKLAEVPTEISEWEIINEQKKKQRVRLFKIVFTSAVAASIILVIGTGNGWFTKNSQRENTIPQQAKATENGKKIDPLMAMVQHEVNTSGKIKKFIAPDGSEISLYDSSEITYKEPAEGNVRSVYLLGKAGFKVAKNKAKPFTVFSGEISTTAIGTVFTVTARQNEKFIRIRLDEGKVVVKPLNGYNPKWAKDFYMTPGQELTYDKSKQTASLQSLNDRTATNKANDEAIDNPTIPNYDKGSWFMFNNQSLSEVFDALSAMYDVKIVYSKKDINNKYFIGTYDKSDSLENILKTIALLNKLQVSKLSDGYKIEKILLKK